MKKNRLVKVTSMVMSVVITGMTFFSYFSITASAADTLLNIENIRNIKSASGTPFKIVEIAPSRETGTMGYYALDQEPGEASTWKRIIEGMTSSEDRAAYANGLFTKLENHNLMNGQDTESAPPSVTSELHPLHKTGNYAEHKPWDEGFNAENYSKINLQAPETYKARGKFTLVDDLSGAYNADYTYRISDHKEIFKAEEWFNNNGKRVDEFLSFEHATDSEIRIEEPNTVIINNNSGDFFNYMKQLGSITAASALIAVEGDTGYTVAFSAELNPPEEMAGGVKVYGYKASSTTNNTQVDLIGETSIEFSENGDYGFSFTTPADIDFIELNFGAKGNGEVRFKNFSISTGGPDAEYVQDAAYFDYGEPAPTYGENLFSFGDWAANTYSCKLNNEAVNGNSLTVDQIAQTFRVTSGSITDLYTKYGGNFNYYFMAVKPNTEYEISFTQEVAANTGQLYVFTYNENMQGAALSAVNNGYDLGTSHLGINKTASGTYSARFTTSETVKYVQFRIGTRGTNADVTFSDIRLREVLHPQYYYYDVAVHSEHRFVSGQHYVYPYEGAAVYTKDDDGHYKFEFFFYSDSDVTFLYNKVYYTLDVKPGTWPSESFDADTHPYRAESMGFRKAGTMVEFTDPETHLLNYMSVTDEDMPELIEYLGSSERLTVWGKETAFFAGDLNSLTYVGSGGNCNFEADPGKPEYNMIMNSAFYSGGFYNNNWFKYYVLDAEDKDVDGSDLYKFNIQVDVVTPDDPELNNKLQFADLIVISAGLDISLESGTAVYSSDIADADIETIKATVADYIETQKMPVMVDYSLLSATSNARPNLKALCASILGGMDHGGVNGSVYAFSASDLNQSTKPVKSIANAYFLINQPAGNMSVSTHPYFPVIDEINKENVVRNRGTTGNNLNQSYVTEATCLRYILNYRGQRNYGTWDGKELLVLDIEPMTSKPSITASDILSLLPDVDPYNTLTEDNIKIIPMAVAEFVAKNEDFSEIYDIIYIGSSNENMNHIPNEGDNSAYSFRYQYYDTDGSIKTDTCNWSNGKGDPTYQTRFNATRTNQQRLVVKLGPGDPVYNDERMNGMYYTNVGDTIVTSKDSTLETKAELGGLLGSDYTRYGDGVPGWIEPLLPSAFKNWLDRTYSAKGQTATVRASGNDINEATMERLLDFANSGRPVIVSDELSEHVYEDLTASISLQHCDNHDEPIERYSNDSGFTLKLRADVDSDSEVLSSILENATFVWECSTDGTHWKSFNNNIGQEIETPTKASDGTDLLKVSGFSRKTDNIYTFNVSSGGYFRCNIQFTVSGKAYSVPSNKLRVYKTTPNNSTNKSEYDRYYMTYSNPQKDCPYKDDYLFSLRNGNLQVPGEDYDYYYEGKDSWGQDYPQYKHFTSPKFIDIMLYFEKYTWFSWRSADPALRYGYNSGALTPQRIIPENSYLYLKTEPDNHQTLCIHGFKDGTETSGALNRDDLEISATGSGDYKNQPVCYYLPKFNWTPEPSSSTHINLNSELLAYKFDNCSYMWRFLSSVFYERTNVISLADSVALAAENSVDSDLARSLIISKPKIILTERPEDRQNDKDPRWDPKEYSDQYGLDACNLGENALEIPFKVQDDSNQNKNTATYTAKVYIDSNADGKFTEDEIRDDVTKHVAGVDQNTTVTVPFTNGEKGIIPWKLVVTENGSSQTIAGHASYSGYSYIKPKPGEAIEINAIMILPGAWATHQYGAGSGNTKLRQPYYTDYYDDSGHFINNHYKSFADQIYQKYIKIGGLEKKITHLGQWQANEYIGNVFESPIFDNLPNLERMTMQELGVGKDGIGTDGFPHIGFKVNGNDILIDIAIWDIHQMNNYFTDDSTNAAAIRNKFAAYNMMILGFSDSWGKLPSTQMDIGFNVETLEGLELESAQAIEYFINSGRATLFCHDTTNKSNVFINYIANDIAQGFINAMSKLGSIGNQVLEWFGFDSYFDTISDSSFLKSSRVKQGFYNNIVLRETLGLDRYGITYAIRERAEAIANGKDPNFTGQFADGNPYGTAMGAAYYAPARQGISEKDKDIIYAYSYAKDAAGKNILSVENMLTYKDEYGVMRNHSIAYVPGSAQTYSRAADASPSHEESNPVKLVRTLVVDPDTGIQTYHYVAEKFTKATVSLGENKLTKSTPINYMQTVDSQGNATGVKKSIGLLQADYDKYAQGFTDYTITRYFEGSSQKYPSATLSQSGIFNKDTIDTTKITQINSGKITSYPYDINVANLHSLEGMNTELTVKTTHEQVYQCNMNGDDITVWYALSGGPNGAYYDKTTGKGIRNNAANAYYIYSRKNVVYTGAGHTNTFSPIEAKLFINTLVSAYRTAGTAPNAIYEDAEGKTQKYFYVVQNGNEIEPIFNDDFIRFRIQDKNTGFEKYPSARFWFNDDYQNKEIEVKPDQFYKDPGKNAVTTTYGNRITNYYSTFTPSVQRFSFELPDEVINYFKAHPEVTKIRLYLDPASLLMMQNSIVTSDEGEAFYGETVYLDIVKIELSDLA